MSQTALVTGASGGIGYEFAKVLAENKYNLILTARSEDKLNQHKHDFEKKYQVQVSVIPGDLSIGQTPEKIFHRVNDLGLQTDVLINNAGFGDYGEFINTRWNRQAEMIELNVTSLTHLTRLFLPGMVERRRGKIVNVASTAAFIPGPFMSVYYGSKAFVLSFSEAIANELKPTGVTVTCLCPGPTQSDFQSRAYIENAKFIKGKKLPTSEEVARYGYAAMMKGKTVAVAGFNNKVLSMIPRFLPRDICANIVSMIQKSKV